MVIPSETDQVPYRRGRRLQYATIAWNLMEVFVTIGLGLAAGSLALIAFGLDSLVEVFASVAVIWYIADHEADGRSRRALVLVAIAFATLAVYLIAASTYNVVSGAAAESSSVGIAYLAITAVVMFLLAKLKRTTANAARSAPLAAEASMTHLDGWLATGILIALILNAVAGLWWADPAAAAVVALFCLREAGQNWKEARIEPTSAGPSPRPTAAEASTADDVASF
jgi:divalent metal cation (Fe/Co/Zn/Cd) transporter